MFSDLLVCLFDGCQVEMEYTGSGSFIGNKLDIRLR